MRDAVEFHDIIVVGAGGAGLACASRLAESKRDVLVLESRARIGGRVFSLDESYPIELGAEFVHGAPPVTLRALADARLAFYNLQDHHLLRKGRSLKKTDFFARIDGVMDKLNPKRKLDRTVAEFLKSRRIPAETLDIFRSFVEGFHAADLDLIGEKALSIAEESGDGDLNGVSMFRTAKPYVAILEPLRSRVSRIELQTRVRAVRWRAGEVVLHCLKGDAEVRFRCKRLVVTLPAGVLKAPLEREGVLWDPMPEELHSYLAAVEMGHVQKLVCEFRSRFWEDLSSEPITFLHMTADRPFPTWWTANPMRTPMLTGWQGGPRARDLAELPLDRRVEAALQTLAEITRKSKRWLRSELKGVHTHNWSLDPNSYGAYSYVRVGGVEDSRRLSRPLERTLYFAGEGFSPGSARGTVHGALESGVEAARAILGEGV